MTERVKGIMFSVILIVIALLMLPLVIDSVQTVLSWSTTSFALSDFAGVGAITGLIPLLVTVGIIIVAVLNGLWAMKKGG